MTTSVKHHEGIIRMSRTIGRFSVVATLALVGAALATPAAQAAVGSPSGLAVSTVGASTPVLTWARARKATSYQVQVDNDPGFGSPEFDTKTDNHNAVPTKHLRPGMAHWRVRAINGRDSSSWVIGSFSVNAADVPAPVSPADGDLLPQPQSPPLLRWTTSRGAIGYVVEVDGDSDFVGAKQYKTKSTSLVVPDALGEGDWFWRVIADKGDGIVSSPSRASTFLVRGLELPRLSYPDSSFDQPIEDVVLDWEPVAGAQTYDLQVALDDDFNNIALNVEGVHGTRYSPPTTLNNDEFWWRVRAVDTAGLPTSWQKSRYNFKRVFPDTPVAKHPVGTNASPGVQGTDTTFFEWTPVQHASMYEIEVATSPTFSGETIFGGCRTSNTQGVITPGTTMAPRFTGKNTDCLIPATTDPSDPQVYWWHVRPLDQPYLNTGLPGNFSAAQAFIRSPLPATTDTPPTNWLGEHGQKLKVTMAGTGAPNAGKGCISTPSQGYPGHGPYARPAVCAGMSATPVFSWERQPNMDYYVVWFAQDENFTTTEVQPIATRNTVLALDNRKGSGDPLQLPDSAANRPYYWYVQPCRNNEDCGPTPRSQSLGVAGAASFEKTSPKVTDLTSTSGAGNEITFSWRDYADTNVDTVSYNESGIQSAKQYRVLVDNEPGFSDPLLDVATVDQATYTAADGLYPEGTLFWKVRAIDTQGNQVGESSVQSVTKSSPPVSLSSPVGGASVSGTTPLEWVAQAYALQYTVEVYRNGDNSFSAANRVLSVTTRNASYAPTAAIPASSTPYLWRVRRIDPSKNPGPWSAPTSFKSLGSAPELLSPGGGSLHRGNDLVLAWSDVPGAATYAVAGSSSTGDKLNATTVASAYAPTALKDGSWTWNVTALDSDGEPLGTSSTSGFRVDGTAPIVTAMKPSGSTKPKSVFVLKFSEKVQGVSKKSVKLYQKGKKKPLKAKLLVKRGIKATLKPKAKLKKGKTYLVKVINTKVRDEAGNVLVRPKKWSVTVK